MLMLLGIAAAQEDVTAEIGPEYAAEVAAILANPKVRDGMEHIVSIEPQSRRDLVELTEIPAPPFGEAERAARYAEMLREAGLTDVTIDDEGNAFFVVRVRTLESSLGEGLPIIPGMVAEVDVLTGKKSILSYLLKPVLRAKSNALTER